MNIQQALSCGHRGTRFQSPTKHWSDSRAADPVNVPERSRSSVSTAWDTCLMKECGGRVVTSKNGGERWCEGSEHEELRWSTNESSEPSGESAGVASQRLIVGNSNRKANGLSNPASNFMWLLHGRAFQKKAFLSSPSPTPPQPWKLPRLGRWLRVSNQPTYASVIRADAGPEVLTPWRWPW